MRIPSEEHYSTRCRISHRPPFQTETPIFFRCGSCGALTVVSTRPRTGALPKFSCCGQALEPLEVCRDEAVLQDHRLAFTVFGGFEHSAVRITVDGGGHPMADGHRIEWMYLRTFQGGQLKFLPAGTRSIAHFSLADDDAYVYCDRDICRMGREHCQFACKRGMEVYAYCSVHGLMRLILTGM